MTSVFDDGTFIRYTYTIDFPEPPIDESLSNDERTALLNQHRDAIYQAAERLDALLSSQSWADSVVALGILSRSYISH